MRVDLISRGPCTPEVLTKLPADHPNLRRYDGRVIAVLERFQHCGNVAFDHLPSLGHHLPVDLQPFAHLFEGFIVLDEPRTDEARLGRYGRLLYYNLPVCGDNGQSLRHFTEGESNRLSLAAEPGETIWFIRVTLDPRKEHRDHWSVSARSYVAEQDDGGWWYIRDGWWDADTSAPIIFTKRAGQRSRCEQRACPWAGPLITEAKSRILRDPNHSARIAGNPAFTL